MTENVPANVTAHVNRIQMKVPPFWHQDPEIWFMQLEHAFALSRITADDTKFSCVVANLEAKTFREVRDIMANPPATNKYDKIKTELIHRLCISQERKTKQLLEHETLGDRKPSQFLRQLQALAGNAIPENLLKSIWLNRLPAHTQAILATRSDDTLEKLT